MRHEGVCRTSKPSREDPILVWENMRGDPDVRELADFAILCLGVAVNQAGNEQNGKDVEVGAATRAEHTAAGFIDPHEKGKNNDDTSTTGGSDGALRGLPQFRHWCECVVAGVQGNDSEEAHQVLLLLLIVGGGFHEEREDGLVGEVRVLQRLAVDGVEGVVDAL
ncbi:hypothetical protein B0H14DRAFT_3445219 [Mycena olivaceomarginata]|nr:hypothetical protein B0H14DRAFT_3445219 [Mycena olivaceomarginata]